MSHTDPLTPLPLPLPLSVSLVSVSVSVSISVSDRRLIDRRKCSEKAMASNIYGAMAINAIIDTDTDADADANANANARAINVNGAELGEFLS
mmetsp:Transcript_10371/g.17000  ORF Transcript_10371/g.17000 Transcript_10371/m.17000 type:complete len:93 (+) Transcript_10371:495-773(+)